MIMEVCTCKGEDREERLREDGWQYDCVRGDIREKAQQESTTELHGGVYRHTPHKSEMTD